jgi:Raf kinase inhibitor-like YbhB/YbcL family protein
MGRRVMAALWLVLAVPIDHAAGQDTGLALRSPVFTPGGEIPSRYTCEGLDLSPPLAWTEPPPGTQSFALVLDDPDAPDPKAPQTTWVHWVVVGIPLKVRQLADGAGGGRLPTGARNGLNDWKRADYGGPCPPIGRHRYFYKLYALDTTLSELSSPSKAELERAMQGHVLARAELIGTYEKKHP